MPRCIICPDCSAKTYFHRGGKCVRCYQRGADARRRLAKGIQPRLPRSRPRRSRALGLTWRP